MVIRVKSIWWYKIANKAPHLIPFNQFFWIINPRHWIYNTIYCGCLDQNAGWRASSRSAGRMLSPSTSKIGMECSDLPASSSDAADATIVGRADMGVLTCDVYSTCVPDESSSQGGRCIALSTSWDLETSCTKCNGTKACLGLDQAFRDNYIGCNSCNGPRACIGIDRKSFLVTVAFCITTHVSAFDLSLNSSILYF
jgi:hypothetical protein